MASLYFYRLAYFVVDVNDRSFSLWSQNSASTGTKTETSCFHLRPQERRRHRRLLC